MRIAVFDAHKFEVEIFERFNSVFGFDIKFFETRLNSQTASLTKGFDVVCSFVNDRLDEEALKQLKENKIGLIALRSAGFNHVDLASAKKLDIKVVRVPAYSPHAVAEHAVALILSLNRKIHRAYQRVRELNFSLDGLVGFDLNGKTVGVIGTGKIGVVFAKIMSGFGCRILAYDIQKNPELNSDSYVSLDEIFEKSDVISLHVPLVPGTKHMINELTLSKMKDGVILINTGRGALIDSKALIQALKSGKIGAAGLDVYEEEENVFFQDLSNLGLQDDTLARLLTFPNVLITSHQAFLTNEALGNIVETTLRNIAEFKSGHRLTNQVQ